MKSLFLKIFLSFWAAQALFVVLAILVTIALSPARHGIESEGPQILGGNSERVPERRRARAPTNIWKSFGTRNMCGHSFSIRRAQKSLDSTCRRGSRMSGRASRCAAASPPSRMDGQPAARPRHRGRH